MDAWDRKQAKAQERLRRRARHATIGAVAGVLCFLQFYAWTCGTQDVGVERLHVGEGRFESLEDMR